MKKLMGNDIDWITKQIKDKNIVRKWAKFLLVFEVIMIILLSIMLYNEMIDIFTNSMNIEIWGNGISSIISKEIVSNLPTSYLFMYVIEENLGRIIGIIAIHFFRSICNNIVNYKTPFGKLSVEGLYKFGIILLVYNTCQIILSFTKYFILVESNKIEVLQNITGGTITFFSEAESGSIFIALIMIFLSGIFKVGLELKEENEMFV